MSENQSLLTDDITSPNFLQKQGKLDKTVTPQDYGKAIAWVVFGVPLLIVGIVIAMANSYYKKLFGPKPVAAKGSAPEDYPIYEAQNLVAYDQRQWDLVIFGATGFTGSIVVEYVLEEYFFKTNNKAPFTFAVAGRNQAGVEKALTAALTQLSTRYSADLSQNIRQKVGIIIADSFNEQQLRDMVNNTKSIITTVGPFDKYGAMLVGLCAAYGTHRADITGETDFHRKMIDKYEAQAKQTGAIITSFAGHDCIPWDIACDNAAQMLKTKFNECVTKFTVYDHISGGISGGTLDTILHSLIGRKKYKAQLGFDPLMSIHGEKSTHDLKMVNQMMLSFDKKENTWVGPFVMAQVMGNCIRRSNAVNKYGGPDKKIIYHEKNCYKSLWHAIPEYLGLMALGVGLYLPFVPALMSKYLPPGSGPSKEEQEQSYLLIKVCATGDKGTVVESWCYIPKDPGYFFTARMLTECGLVPILNKKELATLRVFDNETNSCGGIWTPASCLGPVLQKRLENIGIVFTTKKSQQQQQ